MTKSSYRRLRLAARPMVATGAQVARAAIVWLATDVNFCPVGQARPTTRPLKSRMRSPSRPRQPLPSPKATPRPWPIGRPVRSQMPSLSRSFQARTGCRYRAGAPAADVVTKSVTPAGLRLCLRAAIDANWIAGVIQSVFLLQSRRDHVFCFRSAVTAERSFCSPIHPVCFVEIRLCLSSRTNVGTNMGLSAG